MSVNYIDKSTGDLIRVAGQGKAEYGASTVRKGTVAFEIDPQTYTTVSVTFATPMPDADYLVDVSFPTQQPISYYVINNKTKNGFSLFIKNNGAEDANASVTYTAFKLYTDTEYNNLLNNAVLTSDVTDSVTNGDMNPVTSNAVYDALAAITGYDYTIPYTEQNTLEKVIKALVRRITSDNSIPGRSTFSVFLEWAGASVVQVNVAKFNANWVVVNGSTTDSMFWGGQVNDVWKWYQRDE